MTSPQPQTPRVAPADGAMPTRDDGSGQPVSTLRGAGVAVDGRRVGKILVAACLAGLAVLTVVLFIAGADKNAQITRLRQHGVPVRATVTHCFGNLGGSGSNGAGYSCQGTYTLGGHRHTVDIPGSTVYARGDTIRGIAVPGDPSLFSTPGIVAGEQASGRVFVGPTLLLALLVGLAGLILVRRRVASGATGPSGPPDYSG